MLIGKNATSSGTATTDLVAVLFALALAILFAGSGSGVPQASKDGSRPGGVDPEIPVFAGGTPPSGFTVVGLGLLPAARFREAAFLSPTMCDGIILMMK
jgi:hypothetical protein